MNVISAIKIHPDLPLFQLDSGLGRQVLTGNGSWFINEMLNQLKTVIS